MNTVAARPTVSVVIPCYNAARTILRAVDSVRAQDSAPTEIIVVDDASTDGSRDVLAAKAGKEVRVIYLDRNQGAAAARNAGIEASSGEFISFLDADDEWLPTKLSRQLAVIARRPTMTLVACKASFVRLDGTTQGDLYDGFEPASGPDAWRTLLAYNFIATPTVVARRDAINKVGAFDPTLIVGEDQDLWIRLALEGEVGFVPEPLVVVHSQPGSLSYKMSLNNLEYGLPMVLRHFMAQQHRLSAAEQRWILGHRFTKFGRQAYHEFPCRGSWLILKAIAMGHDPLGNSGYLLNASPAARWLKRRVLGRR